MYRWKLAIQRYDFRIQHIPGETNVVADAFSRCVFDEHTTEQFPVQAVAVMNELVLSMKYVDDVTTLLWGIMELSVQYGKCGLWASPGRIFAN